MNRPNYLQATRICYEDTEAFPLEVKKAVMLMFQTQGRITDFFMRGLTLTGLVHKEESHAFIIQILHDLLQRQVPLQVHAALLYGLTTWMCAGVEG